MKTSLRITTDQNQLREGLFGQIFLWVFEILPRLDAEGIMPHWCIRSSLYGAGVDSVVIPGLLELNYAPPHGPLDDIKLLELRSRHAVSLGSDWEYLATLWSKYFRFPERVLTQASCYPSLDGALGLHYRGTDKNRALEETNYVSADDFLALVTDFIKTHPEVRTLYVASDEPSFAGQATLRFPSLTVINSGSVVHHKDADKPGALPKGEHALLDCLLLSRCRYLLKCQSALSGFAKILNPKLQAYRVSANKLAHWSWGIPYFPDAYLPMLTSTAPECQAILTKLLAGDWTQDPIAKRRYSGAFQYRRRKGYMLNMGKAPRWSVAGIHQRIDSRVESVVRKLSRFS